MNLAEIPTNIGANLPNIIEHNQPRNGATEEHKNQNWLPFSISDFSPLQRSSCSIFHSALSVKHFLLPYEPTPIRSAIVLPASHPLVQAF